MINKEKQLIEIKECIDNVYGADCAYYDVDGFAIADEVYKAGFRKLPAGEWVYKYKHEDIAYCSNCNFYVQDKINNVAYCYHFCPNCGAMMKGNN